MRGAAPTLPGSAEITPVLTSHRSQNAGPAQVPLNLPSLDVQKKKGKGSQLPLGASTPIAKMLTPGHCHCKDANPRALPFVSSTLQKKKGKGVKLPLDSSTPLAMLLTSQHCHSFYNTLAEEKGQGREAAAGRRPVHRGAAALAAPAGQSLFVCLFVETGALRNCVWLCGGVHQRCLLHLQASHLIGTAACSLTAVRG